MSSETISSRPSYNQVVAEEALSHIVDALVGRKIRSIRNLRKGTMAHLAGFIGVICSSFKNMRAEPTGSAHPSSTRLLKHSKSKSVLCFPTCRAQGGRFLQRR
jgi:hypothetical protein